MARCMELVYFGLLAIFGDQFVRVSSTTTTSTTAPPTTTQPGHVAEGPDHAVQLTYYQVAPGDWNADSLKATMATRFNDFCNDFDALSCNLAQSGEFVPSDVILVPGYPKVKEGTKDTDVKFYMRFPSGGVVHPQSSTSHVLPKEILLLHVRGERLDLESASGTYITYIEDEFHGIPPADLANKVIIPVAILVVILLVAVTCFLNYMQRRKFEKERRSHQLNIIKETSKVSPVYNIKTDEKSEKRINGNNMDKRQRQKKDDWYQDKNDLKKRNRVGQQENDLDMNSSKTNPTNPTTPASFDDYPDKQQSALPPLKYGMDSDENSKDAQKIEKKKKKKKKHHRRRDDDADGQANVGYHAGASDASTDDTRILHQAEYSLTTEL